MTTTKIGRPPIGPAVQVRFSPELLTQLDAYAVVEGVSRAEAIRRIINQAMGAKRMSTKTRTYDEAAHAIDAMHSKAIRAARETRDAIEEAVGYAFDEAIKPFGDQPPSEACPQAVAAYDDGMERAKRVYRVLADAADEMARAARVEISGMPGITPMGTVASSSDLSEGKETEARHRAGLLPF